MIFFKYKEHILYFYVIIRMIYITKEILKAFLSNKKSVWYWFITIWHPYTNQSMILFKKTKKQQFYFFLFFILWQITVTIGWLFLNFLFILFVLVFFIYFMYVINLFPLILSKNTWKIIYLFSSIKSLEKTFKNHYVFDIIII